MAACTKEDNAVKRRSIIEKTVAALLHYRKLPPILPPVSIHTKSDFGQTRCTERKDTLQPESDLLSGKPSKERFTMSNSNNNQLNIPQAREAMDRFKMQAAQDEDVSAAY